LSRATRIGGVEEFLTKFAKGYSAARIFHLQKFLIAFVSPILKTHAAEVCPVCSPIFEQWLGVLSLGTV
jgi:hypothetical protein